MDLNSATKFILIFSVILATVAGIVATFNIKKKQIDDNKHIIILIASLICVLIFFIIRAYLKGFFPFTDKVESFVTLYFLLVVTAVLFRKRLFPHEFIALLFTGIIFAVIVSVFTDRIRFPSPYLRTLWYPLHVPLSFAAYAFWIAAGVRSLFIMITKEGDSGLASTFNKYGFIMFTLSMIFGGIWGYISWGAYFMWDPKILWSVILWIFYGNMLHIDNIPAVKKWKHSLFVIGILLILVTFIGTGFFTRSIHRF